MPLPADTPQTCAVPAQAPPALAPAWEDFIRDLAAHLARQWPAMPERLGDRYPAFIEHAVQQAQEHGLQRAAAVARYVNLWFVWGAGFQDKPGFEWAAAALAGGPTRAWATVHRLVRRSLQELQRLPDARIRPETLAAADAGLIERYAHLGSAADPLPQEPDPAPRQACDVLAAELSLVVAAVDRHYEPQAGQWQRVALPAPAPLRCDAATPWPALVAVLSRSPGATAPAQLQIRLRTHAVCDADVHPVVCHAGSHGLLRQQGLAARVMRWPVFTLAQALPPAGAASALAEETSPDIFKLEVHSCGLRDDDEPLGAVPGRLQTLVWVWPAAQWWLDLQRGPGPGGGREGGGAGPAAQHPDGPAASVGTRCRLECDGAPQDTRLLQQRFEQGLDADTEQALQTLARAWAQVAGLDKPRLQGSLALLLGRATATWGWRLGPRGMDGRPLMRLLADLQMQACAAALHWSGELNWGGARGLLHLRCEGQALLQARLGRESAEPPLLPVMQAARLRFVLPLHAEITPLATDDGAVLGSAGPCRGALEGEAGLRPRTSGGSGWEWFAQLRLQAVSLPVTVLDPLLGMLQCELPLLPEQPLLDWRLA